VYVPVGGVLAGALSVVVVVGAGRRVVLALSDLGGVAILAGQSHSHSARAHSSITVARATIIDARAAHNNRRVRGPQ
jgi:hypothetical protein